MADQTQDFPRGATRDMLLAGRYRLIAPLGRGGMGTVWRAIHLALDSEVAVKLVDPVLASTESGRLRFQREAQAAAGIRSPHVVQILDHGVDQGTPYIVMELLEGESLAQRLDRVGTLSLEETASVLTQVARAMSRAHEAGVVHRDLKPDNVFLVRNDDEEVAKVLDFGIAKANFGAGPENTKTGAILGTPHYMSPEQLRGEKGLDYRADLWALGVIAYECVCGRRPFESETFPDLVIKICSEAPRPPTALLEVPSAFDAWFARAVQRQPGQRFQSARELAHALREVASGASGPGAPGAALGAEPAGPRPPPPPAVQDPPAAVQVRETTQHATAHTQPDAQRPAPRGYIAALGVGLLIACAAAVVVWRDQRSEVQPEGGAAASVSAQVIPESASQSSASPISQPHVEPSVDAAVGGPSARGAPSTSADRRAVAAPSPLSRKPSAKPAATSGAKAKPSAGAVPIVPAPTAVDLGI